MLPIFNFTTAAALLTLAATGTFAHDQPHAKKATDYSRAEETPFGRAADPRKAQRTIRVEMDDQMRFLPAEITVKRGETLRFVPTNKGQVMHEMVLGTMDELKAHAELMRKYPGMEHDEPHMAHVGPGKSGEIGWQFTKAGEFYYACLIPGHFEAGMVGKVIVLQPSIAHKAAQDENKGASTPSVGPLSEGEVRRVDKQAKKVTIRHGPLVNLDMPAMTMVFRVKDESVLARLRAGDKIRFLAENIDGVFVVTRIEPAR